MPIYIAVEVARRELEGRLLLGLVAAERGHDVVLGKIPHRALLAGELDGWRLPPGILHLKSITASERIYERFDRMRSDGMRITVQDEEHGLSAEAEYLSFGRLRFPAEAVTRADAFFAWGLVDHDWLVSAHPGRASEVTITGSPRIDLWRQDLIGSAGHEPGATAHVLFISSTSPFSINPFWTQIHQQRKGSFGPGFEGLDDSEELKLYDLYADAFHYVKHAVLAVRRLAIEFPERRIVVRPHHFELPEAWEAVLGEYPNVVVRADGTARAWVRDAAVVIHGGSTVGIEASVARRPVVAFVPGGILDESPANALGVRASDIDELLGHVNAVLSSAGDVPPSTHDAEFLASRLASLDGPLAADRIVDEWERMMTPATGGRVERIVRRPSLRAVGRPLRVVRDAVRRGLSEADSGRTDKGPFAMEVEHKFPSLDVDALRADAARLANHLGRFKDVEIVQIGEREVLLRAAGR